jgi:hypothetical protein
VAAGMAVAVAVADTAAAAAACGAVAADLEAAEVAPSAGAAVAGLVLVVVVLEAAAVAGADFAVLTSSLKLAGRGRLDSTELRVYALMEAASPSLGKHRADVYLKAAKRYTHVPLKQAVISASALSLLYPQGGLAGYSREEYLGAVVAEQESEIRRCLQNGAHVVQIDFTEARLSIKLDSTLRLLEGSLISTIWFWSGLVMKSGSDELWPNLGDGRDQAAAV